MPIEPKARRTCARARRAHPFENFFHAFFPSVSGVDSVPLGGHKDGGADAFDGNPLYEGETRATSFYQASVEEGAGSAVQQQSQ